MEKKTLRLYKCDIDENWAKMADADASLCMFEAGKISEEELMMYIKDAIYNNRPEKDEHMEYTYDLGYDPIIALIRVLPLCMRMWLKTSKNASIDYFDIDDVPFSIVTRGTDKILDSRALWGAQSVWVSNTETL